MVAPAIEERFLIAGREYGRALEKLGLQPHALFWAFDQAESRHVLVLVTDFFDYKGPLEVSKHLFRAYNASVTPQEIDPFIIRLHSPKQTIGLGLLDLAANWDAMVLDRTTMLPSRHLPPIAAKGFAGLEVQRGWVVSHERSRKKSSADLGRQWNRFHNNVERVAA